MVDKTLRRRTTEIETAAVRALKDRSSLKNQVNVKGIITKAKSFPEKLLY